MYLFDLFDLFDLLDACFRWIFPVFQRGVGVFYSISYSTMIKSLVTY